MLWYSCFERNTQYCMFIYKHNTTCKGKCQQQQVENGGNHMCNKDIREYAEKHNVRLWQIASKLGINDGNFSRKLRVELPQDKKAEIKAIIDDLAAE